MYLLFHMSEQRTVQLKGAHEARCTIPRQLPTANRRLAILQTRDTWPEQCSSHIVEVTI